ncbi:DUF4097 family beta strand repeat-containing protein [Stackebrandtia nassauensis]|uniref:DUF4097 domain-containing protein n=1 Tax=Stackebrandtia nassauensis (strain DSM 44728 / CIP 108903 / NRRL B-16338 / NBRC 102104 / LLR-40K-21) TaxID=446470 RepID=D3PZ33_STANL|nr:DUF4097 family beta strand repeat-containing protein [Stackebrandtia nassauensis]ADD45462.1 hypothetical protein Snas_5832 [Stackebrandtia nassauensis DSM 44728]
MPTFETPKPVNVEITVMLGNVTVTAEDRTDTTVTVTPTNPDNEADVKAASETHVELSGDTVTIKGLKFRKYIGPTKNNLSVDISVAVPTGSSLFAKAYGSVLNLTTSGRLDRCEFRTGAGRLVLDHVGPMRLRTDGNIVIDRADGDVDATTSTGNIRISEVKQGTVELKTSFGEIEVGVPEGTAALLDLQTSLGSIRNHLTDTSEPAPDDRTVKVRARTSGGDIEIRRS